jgi:hypothetical protein
MVVPVGERRGELTRDEAAELTRLALSVQRELGCA